MLQRTLLAMTGYFQVRDYTKRLSLNFFKIEVHESITYAHSVTFKYFKRHVSQRIVTFTCFGKVTMRWPFTAVTLSADMAYATSLPLCASHLRGGDHNERLFACWHVLPSLRLWQYPRLPQIDHLQYISRATRQCQFSHKRHGLRYNFAANQMARGRVGTGRRA